MEDPKTAKGLVRREVTRVVTPGVATEEELLEERGNRFVAALALGRPSRRRDQVVGLACVDVSTGEFFVSEVRVSSEDLSVLEDEICRIGPAELLMRNRTGTPATLLTNS